MRRANDTKIDCTRELYEQSTELAQICEYLDVIADIVLGYRLSNFGIWMYLMEISHTKETLLSAR